jgi:hypothetical protein
MTSQAVAHIPIDLWLLVSSEIDCEFKDTPSEYPVVGKVVELTDQEKYKDQYGRRWKTCKPRTNHWNAWDKCTHPLPRGCLVKVRYRNNGYSRSKPVKSVPWNRVIAFKFEGLEDGYCWPWEAS